MQGCFPVTTADLWLLHVVICFTEYYIIPFYHQICIIFIFPIAYSFVMQKYGAEMNKKQREKDGGSES